MSSPQISFIIPVFNTEAYIEKCILSITKLSDIGIEIIAVDDCSVDSSYSLLTEIKNRIPELQIYQNEKNSGVSFTRNRGVSIAKGNYISFVDSDDYILPESYKKMFEIVQKENADAIIGNISNSTIGGGIANEEKYHIYYSDTVFTPNHVCGGLFRLDTLKRNHVSFNEKMTVGEDQLFNFEFVSISGCKTIHFESKCYFFNERPVSLMHGKRTEEKKKQIFESHLEMLKVLESYRKRGIDDMEAVRIKVVQQRQNTAYTLMQIFDNRYVNLKLEELKKLGYYPYKVPSWLIPKESFLKTIVFRCLPIECLAKAFHFAWKFTNR